jgi:hypothetical protein
MLVLVLSSLGALPAAAQLGIPKPPAREVIVRPKEIDDVLNNPGIGFQTFQRFNGDDLNPGNRWTEGHPIEYQPFDGDLTNPTTPQRPRPTSGSTGVSSSPSGRRTTGRCSTGP